ncbi:hypothetical protein [Streptomyces buecherae]|uniref:hypothetical protein n=1 Tax=Streptomyces buecherae TaxID=2763006 RepID=UPI001C25DD98|nr:hypothetical protein [Streptomyces buecherae]
MRRRRLVSVVVAVGLAVGCGSDEGPDRSEDARGVEASGVRGARNAVEAYVRALNSRDIAGLIEVGGVPDDFRARREARRIMAEKGDRGLSIVEARVEITMGPNVGSVELAVRDRSGRDARDTLTVVREKSRWNVVVFLDRPSSPDKPTSSTVRP